MRAIHFFGRKYTGTRNLAEHIASRMQCSVLDDTDLIDAAARNYGMKKSDIEKSIFQAPPLLGHFSARKTKAISAVRMTLAEKLTKGPMVSCGFIGRLIPQGMGLHVLSTASPEFRKKQMVRKKGFLGKSAFAKILKKEDKAFIEWSHYLQTFENISPDRCDAVVDAEYSSVHDVIDCISGSLDQKIAAISPKEFSKAAEVEWILAEKGHPVSVTARQRHINLILHKRPFILSRYQKKLSMIAHSIHGVDSVSISPAPFFHQADIYRSKEFSLPSERIVKTLEKKYRKLYSKAQGSKKVFLRKTANLEARIQM